MVGEAKNWLPELIERAKKLNVNGGFEKGADLCVYIYFTLSHVADEFATKGPINITSCERTRCRVDFLCRGRGWPHSPGWPTHPGA